MSRAPKPVIHHRDHEHGGADPVRITYESVGTGTGGFPSFGSYGGYYAPGSTPAFVAVTDYSETTGGTLFDISSGFARILAPGLYQVAAFANVQFTSVPTADETALLYLWFKDNGGSNVGFSMEMPNSQLQNNYVVFPALENRFQALQRLMPISLTDLADFPVTIKPEITFSDASNFSINQSSVWGFRIGDQLASGLSD